MTGDTTKGEADGHDEDTLHEDGQESGLKDVVDDDPKKRKVMSRLLSSRLDKLVAKKDDACVIMAFLASISLPLSMYAVVGTPYRTTSWNYPTRRSGPSTTRQYLVR